MDKSQLRNKAVADLKSLSGDEKKLIEEKLTNQLLESDLWQASSSIGITVSQGFEWNTKKIIEAAWKENKLVAVPKCNPLTKSLTFYQFHTYDQLEIVYYNLKEPNPERSQSIEKNSMDLLIVPGLLFDENRYRIGFGGGYYDRFLTDFKNTTASLASNIQLVDKIPNEIFDLPVNYLVTENGIF